MSSSQIHSLYSDLDNWARSRDSNADHVIQAAVESFYNGAVTDPRLDRFFVDANIEALKKHQYAFMRRLFSGIDAGGYTPAELYGAHEDLILNRGLKTIHFDYFMENFLASLRDQALDAELIGKVRRALVPLRKVFAEAASDYSSRREERLFFALDDDADGSVPEADVRRALAAAGLVAEDDRLARLYAALSANAGSPLQLDTFVRIVGTSGLLVERALQGGLAIPDFEDFAARVDEIFQVVAANTGGQQAQYIPPLAQVEPEQFGVAIVTIDGQVYSRGDHDVDFSIQSMCKPFNYCFALEELGEEEVHLHVGKEPSGRAFNDRDLMARLVSTTADDHAVEVDIPFNPMINAGAIMTAALVKSQAPFEERFRHVRDQWARLIGKPARPGDAVDPVRFNKEMARQENVTGHNNLALGYLLLATGQLPRVHSPEPVDAMPDDPFDYGFFFDPSVESALKLYFATCSLELTANEMATAAATLANGGVCPTTQERVMSQSTVRNCLSVTQMCGMYDGSGDFFYSIGVPGKSGVGGGVVLVVPKLMGVCIFSPRLDAQGSSVRGVETAKRMIGKYRLHSYDGVMTDVDRVDLWLPLARWRASTCADALWAASKGDMRAIQRLYGEHYNLTLGDYDQRTPMHLAAAEGHAEVVEFLLEHGVRPAPDRWGGLPVSDALENGHTDVAELFVTAVAGDWGPTHRVDDPDGPQDTAADYGDDLAVVELLWAAAENDVAGLRRLLAQRVSVHAQDYDRRTALHLAASEGHLEAARYLTAHGHPLQVRDRWFATPLDEARREGRQEVAEFLEKLSKGD